ncbi:hypothetical protein GV827_22000 [Sulfitobacter sp. JBTF-M27]|uniref:Uncharacterized protein n=1 Tax=Sulfitobacter sediminilitoris TaxID=2698830 RepID=A0A6P0CKI1_9RHOB|nr:hypothetical protein [Sulfitobacter sediminilitoris]NEK25043.1 hypothetical protein [Sulfitobacter sediminilitoris]
MADDIPDLVLGISEATESVVFVEGSEQINSLRQLISIAPGLLHPEAAITLAQAVNHIEHGTDYRVIDDTASYEARYRAKLEKEDPNAAWQEGVLRLRDHGIPDFDDIKAPALSGGVLTYFAEDNYLGLPYRIEFDTANPGGDVIYSAVPVTPLPAAEPAPLAPNPLFVGSNEPLVPSDDYGGLELAEEPLEIDDVGEDDEPESQ